MATTTNYGWTTPDDTALVKDGASAIRSLGTSVDTTTKNLNPETTLGDIAYRSSTANVKTRLGLGTAGQVLAVNSGANAPEWTTVSSGGMTSIASGSLSGSSVVISSIPATYNHLQVVVIGFGTSSADAIRFRLNATTSSSYQSIDTFANSGNKSFGATYGVFSHSQAIGTTKSYGILNLFNYANTTTYKLGFSNAISETFNPPAADDFTSAIYGQAFNSTSAIDSVTLLPAGGTFNKGTYQVWGIK